MITGNGTLDTLQGQNLKRKMKEDDIHHNVTKQFDKVRDMICQLTRCIFRQYSLKRKLNMQIQ